MTLLKFIFLLLIFYLNNIIFRYFYIYIHKLILQINFYTNYIIKYYLYYLIENLYFLCIKYHFFNNLLQYNLLF
jgi:hypothetical protein